MEREDCSSTQNEMERNGTGQNGTIQKKEQERNDLAEGPCSRTERNGTISKKSERSQPYPEQ